jgi:hypothetical protein
VANIRIVDKSNTTHRGNPCYQIQVNGKTHAREDGITSYWSEAEALRACAREFGMIPSESAQHVRKDDGDE